MGWVTGRRQNAMLIKSSSSSTVGKDWRGGGEGLSFGRLLRFSCPDSLYDPLLCPDLYLSFVVKGTLLVNWHER